jgi:hypothetical protein
MLSASNLSTRHAKTRLLLTLFDIATRFKSGYIFYIVYVRFAIKINTE